MSAFPRSCLLLSACVGWCVHLPKVLFPLVSNLPSCLPLLDGVSAFSTSCLPLSPIVSSHVSLCRMVCRLPQGLVSTCLPFSPIAHPIASHCLPSCLPVSRCLQLRFIVSHCLPTCVPVLDGVSVFGCLVSPLSPIVSPYWYLCWMVFPIWIISAFKRPCLPMSPIVSPHVCLCWMLCPPSRGLVSYLVSQLVSLLVSLYGGWSHFAFFPKECAVKGS